MPTVGPTGVVEIASAEGGATALEASCLVEVLVRDREPMALPIETWYQEGEGLILEGGRDGWSAVATWEYRPEEGLFEVSLEVSWSGRESVHAGVRVPFRLPVAPEPAWLIPGAFYGQNRPQDCPRPYPRHHPEAAGTGEGLVSYHWSFRADRAAVAAVFAWGSAGCAGLATEEYGPFGLNGLGFSGRGEDALIWLDVPYREEPVRYIGDPELTTPAVTDGDWSPRARIKVRYQVLVGPTDRHAYRSLLRALYERRRPANRLRPWMEPASAAELAAQGLERWHFRRLERQGQQVAILAETASFDREAGDGRGGSVDRENMHVGWVSGAPWAAALLAYGRRREDEDAVAAGAAVLDTISTGISPSGTFWGEWHADRGWSGGWNPSGAVHARTVAEATLFLLRAASAERQIGQPRPAWEEAARSSLSFAARIQREDGNLGLYYDPLTGEVRDWGSAAGLTWIPALLLGADTLAEPAWRDAATRAGRWYASFVEGAFINGAVEDVPRGPTSEDGYAATMAYVALDAAKPEGPWLELARRAADWAMTFRYAYNVQFPAHTLLGEYDFRTRGGDQASSCNQHLHAYGLISLPEMLALWRRTGDRYYLDRTRDNLACFLQFVARQDGDFNARRGMVSERYYQTDCFGPIGGLLTLSHAWSVGVLLHACLAAADEPEVLAALSEEVTGQTRSSQP